MVFYVTIAMIGLASAAAFRWPVMFMLTTFIFAATAAVELVLGVHWGLALRISVFASMTLELSYVIGGAALSARVRRVLAKKNLQA